ncbi:MAG: hypothetical protein N2747_02520 [Chitinophagaceae bacterium]|nr:hypothetical protein [Chitinophagaceae bacterium]
MYNLCFTFNSELLLSKIRIYVFSRSVSNPVVVFYGSITPKAGGEYKKIRQSGLRAIG